jgi:hypothetical protein
VGDLHLGGENFGFRVRSGGDCVLVREKAEKKSLERESYLD